MGARWIYRPHGTIIVDSARLLLTDQSTQPIYRSVPMGASALWWIGVAAITAKCAMWPSSVRAAPTSVRICSVSAPLAPICSTPSAPTMHRVSSKFAPHMSQDSPKEAPRLPPQCPVSVPRSHRICPKAAPRKHHGCPHNAPCQSQGRTAYVPSASRFARSRDVGLWAAIWEREMGGFPWGGACVRCREGAAPDGRLLAAVGRCLRQL